MLSTKIRTTIAVFAATAGVTATALGATAMPAFAATGDCEVQITDGAGKETGKLTIKNGASVDIGKARLNCKDGNVTVTPATRVIGPLPETGTPSPYGVQPSGSRLAAAL